MVSKPDRRKRARIEARVNDEVKELIERAAALQGTSVTDFIVRSVHIAADEAVRQQSEISLSQSDARAFASAIDNPPPPNRELRESMAEYMRRQGDDV